MKKDCDKHEYIWVDKVPDIYVPPLGEHEDGYIDIQIYVCKECGYAKVTED